MLCRSCGRENPADARFCNGCGVMLLDASPQAVESKPPYSEQLPTGYLNIQESSVTLRDPLVPGEIASQVFVGRRREMNALQAALDDALSG